MNLVKISILVSSFVIIQFSTSQDKVSNIECGPTIYFSIVCMAGGQCADLSGGHGHDGNIILEWHNRKYPNQQWAFQWVDKQWFRFISKHTGKTISVADLSNKDQSGIVQASIDEYSNHQLWRMTLEHGGIARFENKGSGLFLSVSSDTGRTGNQLQQRSKSDASYQKWRLEMASMKANVK